MQAAGAVLWRPASTDATGTSIEVAVVHRPHYDDWSFPKGKLESGETPAVAAVREVSEEAGFDCVLGRSLSFVEYSIPTRSNGSGKGTRKAAAKKSVPVARTKRVDYWSARASAGSFVANEEVDRLEWLAPQEVPDALSYDLDREVFGRFVQGPLTTHTAILVRHARAGSKARYKGEDRDRPLDTVGVKQASALVPLLAAFGATEAYSADRVRCVQTIEPWAQSVGEDVTYEKSLTEEGYANDPDSGRERARQIALTSTAVPVICSQGKVIPDLVQWWADHDGLTLAGTRSRKGSVWILSFADGVLVAADYIDSPLPRPESD